MITVSKEQLDTVEYLLEQSAQGNHVLFGLDIVRKVFASPAISMSEVEAYEVENHIEKMITLENLEKQKAYLEQLSEPTLYLVVKTYFNILENNLYINCKESQIALVIISLLNISYNAIHAQRDSQVIIKGEKVNNYVNSNL